MFGGRFGHAAQAMRRTSATAVAVLAVLCTLTVSSQPVSAALVKANDTMTATILAPYYFHSQVFAYDLSSLVEVPVEVVTATTDMVHFRLAVTTQQQQSVALTVADVVAAVATLSAQDGIVCCGRLSAADAADALMTPAEGQNTTIVSGAATSAATPTGSGMFAGMSREAHIVVLGIFWGLLVMFAVISVVLVCRKK